MILAEKVQALRKKNNWSQEELAEQLNISRQSVSKWESGASIPDIDKIIAMSSLFGVSTDYLLKDELEKEVPSEVEDVYEAPLTRNVSVEEADGSLGLVRRLAGRTGPLLRHKALHQPRRTDATLCVLSPVPLIVLGALSEYGEEAGGHSALAIGEDMAGGLGMTILLILVAVAVAIFILCDMQMEKYEYLEKEKLALQYGVEGIVRKKKEDFAARYRMCIVAGVTLCIIGVVPMMMAVAFSAGDLIMIYSVALLLSLVAVAAFLFVWAGSIQDSFDKLLQEGDFTLEKKELKKKTSFFPGAYWCVVTAVFLVIGFRSDDWVWASLVWPVAALLFVALLGVVKCVARGRIKQDL